MKPNQPNILGKGKHRYTIEQDWGNLPADIIWGKTHQVVCDQQGLIYILHTSCDESPNQDTVVIFDDDGNFRNSWGAEYAGGAHGLLHYVESDGLEVLYLTDSHKGLYKTTLKGEILQHIPPPPFYKEQGLNYGAANMCIANNGDLFLAEGYGEAFVLHYNSEGTLLNHFGGRGSKPEHTNWAHGIFIAPYHKKELLHVVTDDPSEIKRFEFNGTYHSTVTGTFLHPRNVHIRDTLWAIPEMQGRVTLIDQSNGEITHLGSSEKTMEEIMVDRNMPRKTFHPERFVSAHGLCFLSHGDIMVTEWVEVGRVSRLRKL